MSSMSITVSMTVGYQSEYHTQTGSLQYDSVYSVWLWDWVRVLLLLLLLIHLLWVTQELLRGFLVSGVH